MGKLLIQTIKSVQLTLTDITEGITSAKAKIEKVMGHQSVNEELGLDENETVHLIHPVCPKCSSDKVIKFGTNPKNLDNRVKIKVQRYHCTNCKNNFNTSLKGYQKDNLFSDEMREKYTSFFTKIKASLRSIRDFMEEHFKISVSHESIRLWTIEEGKKYRTEKEIIGSGIYCYDEQYLKVNGEKRYRLLLIDSMTNSVLGDRIVKHCKEPVIKSFLCETLNAQKVIAIVSDGKPEYNKILKEVRRDLTLKNKIIHQLCTFHAQKNFSKAIWETKKLMKIAGEKWEYKKNFAILSNLLNLTFAVDNPEKASKFANQLEGNLKDKCLSILYDTSLSDHQKAESIFYWFLWSARGHHKIIEKQVWWLKKNWINLTHYLRIKGIPKTNNVAEQYFSRTLQKDKKKRFRSVQSLQGYLWAMDYRNAPI